MTPNLNIRDTNHSNSTVAEGQLSCQSDGLASFPTITSAETSLKQKPKTPGPPNSCVPDPIEPLFASPYPLCPPWTGTPVLQLASLRRAAQRQLADAQSFWLFRTALASHLGLLGLVEQVFHLSGLPADALLLDWRTGRAEGRGQTFQLAPPFPPLAVISAHSRQSPSLPATGGTTWDTFSGSGPSVSSDASGLEQQRRESHCLAPQAHRSIKSDVSSLTASDTNQAHNVISSAVDHGDKASSKRGSTFIWVGPLGMATGGLEMPCSHTN
ncbi:unnamed protein product, partial [Protopolystoma xenopodis]